MTSQDVRSLVHCRLFWWRYEHQLFSCTQREPQGDKI